MRAQPPHDLAFGVVAILDHHRAVQVEKHRVAAGAHRVLQRTHQRLERRARRLVRRPRFGGDRRHDLAHARGARGRGTRPSACWCARSARARPRRTRDLRRGRTTTSGVGERRERVRLVLDEGDDEAAVHDQSRLGTVVSGRNAGTSEHAALTEPAGFNATRPQPRPVEHGRVGLRRAGRHDDQHFAARSAGSRRGNAPSS